MKRRVEAHFGFIVGLMAELEACRDGPYFTLRGQSYPQAGPDFRGSGGGLFATNIVNQLRGCGWKRQSPGHGRAIWVGPGFCPVSD